MRFLVVEAESGGGFLFQFYLSSHLSRLHGKFWDVLQSLAGGDLSPRSLHLTAFAEVVDDFKGCRLFSFCLHASDQIILITILEDATVTQSHTNADILERKE
jgi:hypothetical protein